MTPQVDDIRGGTIPVYPLSRDDDSSISAIAAGDWISLFNGKNFDGWSTYSDGKPVSRGWKVEDGGIRLAGTGGGDIMTAEKFSDFELEFDWKILDHGTVV